MNIIEEKRTNTDSYNNTLPDTIEYVAVWKDTDVNVWNQNIVESSFFFVTKECIRHPHFFGVCHCEVLYLFYKVQKREKGMQLNQYWIQLCIGWYS